MRKKLVETWAKKGVRKDNIEGWKSLCQLYSPGPYWQPRRNPFYPYIPTGRWQHWCTIVSFGTTEPNFDFTYFFYFF